MDDDLRKHLRMSLNRALPVVGVHLTRGQLETLLDHTVPHLRKALYPIKDDNARACTLEDTHRDLTERDLLTLTSIAMGHSVSESSAYMHVPLMTTKSRRARLYHVLGVRDAVEAVVRACQLGVLDLKELPMIQDTRNV